MRTRFLAAVAAVLLGCQQPTAPEAGERLEQVAPSSATEHSRFIVEEAPEEHQGC
jgi:hypothetical protein